MLWFAIFLIASGVGDAPVQPVEEPSWFRDVEIVRVERATAGSGVFAICHRVEGHMTSLEQVVTFYRLSMSPQEDVLPQPEAVCDLSARQSSFCEIAPEGNPPESHLLLGEFHCGPDRRMRSETGTTSLMATGQ
ncbi:MAG: hypothetical protein GC208_01340 [Alphaproteobacteria bacterium]|nr:hypothetical protein [Alphaproteobacteria bacterium]